MKPLTLQRLLEDKLIELDQARLRIIRLQAVATAAEAMVETTCGLCSRAQALQARIAELREGDL